MGHYRSEMCCSECGHTICVCDDKTKRVNHDGARLITEERRRQILVELFGTTVDDAYDSMVLAAAGTAYALHAIATHADIPDSFKEALLEVAQHLWAFPAQNFKPTEESVVKQLTKAGAMIAAEIDKIQRADQN